MLLKEWRYVVKEALSKAQFENASEEAKWLLAGALNRESSFLTLNPTYVPSSEEEERIQSWLKRRLEGEPLSRLKGVREFWSLPFYLNEQTLDPRPETEILVEGVLRWVGQRTAFPWRILDLGTGSGCILIALLYELKEATGVGADLNEGALSIARSNAALNQVGSRSTFRQGNWGEKLEGPFDIVVSNPPYISLKERESLEKGVLNYDPPLALFGGEDGLECYRQLAQSIKPLLAPHGLAAVEVGHQQREKVQSIFQAAGFSPLFILKDLAGIERVIGMGLLTSPPSSFHHLRATR